MDVWDVAIKIKHTDHTINWVNRCFLSLQIFTRKRLVKGPRKGLELGARKGLERGTRKGLAYGARKGLENGTRKGLA